MILTPEYHFYSRVAFNNEAKIVDLCLTMIGSDSEFQESLEELGIHPIDIRGKPRMES